MILHIQQHSSCVYVYIFIHCIVSKGLVCVYLEIHKRERKMHSEEKNQAQMNIICLVGTINCTTFIVCLKVLTY